MEMQKAQNSQGNLEKGQRELTSWCQNLLQSYK